MASTFRSPSFAVALACCLLFLFSCKAKTEFKEEIARLDSAETVLVKAENLLRSVDTASLHQAYDAPARELRGISEKIRKDTLNKQTALFLFHAIEQSGNIRNLLDNQGYLQRAIRESRQRISDLKHDLEADLIGKNKSAEYVVNEINASQKISEAVGRATERAKTAVVRLDSMKTQITALADSLTGK